MQVPSAGGDGVGGGACLCLIPQASWAGAACKILSLVAKRRCGVSYKECKMPSSVLNSS